jgi:hypothetical protein
LTIGRESYNFELGGSEFSSKGKVLSGHYLLSHNAFSFSQIAEENIERIK